MRVGGGIEKRERMRGKKEKRKKVKKDEEEKTNCPR